MNPDRDFDHLLDQWFADGPMEVADRVVVQVGDRIERQSQRPAWRLAWRSPMRPALTYGLAAAAVLVVAVVGYNLLPRGPSVGGPPATATPAPTVTPSSPTAYRTRSFEVPFGLTLVGGWTTGAETAANLELRHGDLNLDPGIESIASLRAPSAPGGAPQPWPADFRAWLANQPEFTPGAPVNVTVGGRPGTQVDVDVSLSATETSRIVLTGEGFNWKTVTTPERWRFIVVVTGPGAGIVIVLATAPERFDAAAAALDQLLGTLVFR